MMLRFTVALNRSNLHTLSLTSNVDLGEALGDTFLPSLSAPSLIELHLSVCSLGPTTVPSLLSYLCSSRASRLFTLKLNGNNFGLEAIETIFNSLLRHNWSLIWLEMHTCGINQSLIDVNNNNTIWKGFEGMLRDRILSRNRLLANKVAWEALGLLVYARPALLLLPRHYDDMDDVVRKSTRSTCRGVTSVEEGEKGEYDSSWKEQCLTRELALSSNFVLARRRLPLELVMHILSYLAPSLSPAQFRRVCAFAEDRDTLPSLSNGLSLPTSSSLPGSSSRLSATDDDSRFPRSHSGLNPYLEVLGTHTLILTSRYEMLSPKHVEQRKVWLKTVGCDRYEPDAFIKYE